MIDLSGKTAVVTGGGSGIGRGIAMMLSSAGAYVVVADINRAGSEATVEDIERQGGRGAPAEVDVTDPNSVAELRRTTESLNGLPQILVNNVGWDIIEPFLENNRDYWARVIDLNYMAPLTVTKEFVSAMVANNVEGSVVNVASDAGRVGSSGETVYAGAKGGVIVFTKSLAREMARHQINVNCVCPGPTETPLFRSQPEKMQEALIKAIPLRRLGDPRDVAGAVCYLVSDLASYVTGQVLSVSGGLTMAG